jgi:hypothetical protein
MSRNASPCLAPAAAVALLALLLPAAAAAQSQGLSIDSQAAFGPRLQARIGINASLSPDAGNPAWQQQAGVVLGDYYFSDARFGWRGVSGGFRATSGLLLGQRSLALGTPVLTSGQGASLTLSRSLRPAPLALGEGAHETWSAAPYIGVGYSGLSLRGGWGFTADVGVAMDAGGLRTRRDGALSPQGLDDLLRELRLRPVLQVGASYAF